MFFSDERLHFFKPLTSKYREHIAQCLCLLYHRQYGASADYGQSLNRDQLVEILEEALTRCPAIILEGPAEDQEQRFKNPREQANWVLKQLLECGWIENQVDPATFQSTFPFTRMGRLFAQCLVDSDSTKVRTRHRNTRNTLNALEAFSARGEVYDLLDAYEYSERIITDFTDVIAELEERKRDLVKEVESQQLVQQASEQFFEFMEKRFQPDIQVRLSADSVEKHREEISRAILKIRKKRKEYKADAERELRRIAPDLCHREQSYLFYVLERIEQRMRNAADVMLPALRRALHGFTKRADIIIRQLSYLNAHQNNDLLDVCKELSELRDEDYEHRIGQAAEAMATLRIQLLDPQQIRLQERKRKLLVDTSVAEHHEVDEDAQQEIVIQQMLDQAFTLNNAELKNYVLQALKAGKKISSAELPVDNAKHLLAMAHVIEVGASAHKADTFFNVEPTGKRIENSPYYSSFDEFLIQVNDSEND